MTITFAASEVVETPLGFKVEHGRIGEGVDVIDLDHVTFHRQDLASGQGD
jgi:hypothetical protein